MPERLNSIANERPINWQLASDRRKISIRLVDSAGHTSIAEAIVARRRPNGVGTESRTCSNGVQMEATAGRSFLAGRDQALSIKRSTTLP